MQEEDLEHVYFCQNPKCRFHVLVPMGLAMSGTIAYEKLQELDCLDIFDDRQAVSRPQEVLYMKRGSIELWSGGTIYLCDDCMNAFEFIQQKVGCRCVQ